MLGISKHCCMNSRYALCSMLLLAPLPLLDKNHTYPSKLSSNEPIPAIPSTASP